MEKLISVAVMRTSDAAEIAGGTDSKTLMYRAGLGLFQSWDCLLYTSPSPRDCS